MGQRRLALMPCEHSAPFSSHTLLPVPAPWEEPGFRWGQTACGGGKSETLAQALRGEGRPSTSQPTGARHMKRLSSESRQTGGKWEFLTATWSIALEHRSSPRRRTDNPFVRQLCTLNIWPPHPSPAANRGGKGWGEGPQKNQACSLSLVAEILGAFLALASVSPQQ